MQQMPGATLGAVRCATSRTSESSLARSPRLSSPLALSELEQRCDVQTIRHEPPQKLASRLPAPPATSIDIEPAIEPRRARPRQRHLPRLPPRPRRPLRPFPTSSQYRLSLVEHCLRREPVALVSGRSASTSSLTKSALRTYVSTQAPSTAVSTQPPSTPSKHSKSSSAERALVGSNRVRCSP